jgi:hypothetical protein
MIIYTDRPTFGDTLGPNWCGNSSNATFDPDTIMASHTSMLASLALTSLASYTGFNLRGIEGCG